MPFDERFLTVLRFVEENDDAADQPRVPAGSPAGGQFASKSGTPSFGSTKEALDWVEDQPTVDTGAYENLPYPGEKDVTAKQDLLDVLQDAGGWFSADLEEVELTGKEVATNDLNKEHLKAIIADFSPTMEERSIERQGYGEVRMLERSGKRYIIDGHHRVAAATMTGRKVKARVLKASK